MESFNPTILVNVSECFIINCNCSQTGVTYKLFYSQQLLHSQPNSPERRESLLQLGSPVGGRKLCHPSPHRPLLKTCTQGRARPCGWDVVHMHANDACARPQEQAHTLTQVLSGLTLNK